MSLEEKIKLALGYFGGVLIKIDFKKELKHLYNPSAKEVAIVDVPTTNYLMVDGTGDPNTAVEEFEEILNKTLHNEYIRHKILQKIKSQGKSVPEISKEIRIEPHKVLNHIVTLRQRGLVDLDELKEEIPTFISIQEG